MDENNNVHILNNAFNLYKSYSSSSGLGLFATTNINGTTQKFPISNLVASLLSSIYYGSSESVNQSVVVVDSNIYLSEHLVNFINDIVIDIKPKS